MFEDSGTLQVLPLGLGHSYVIRADARQIIAQGNKLLRLSIRQGMQQRGFYDAENCCRGSYPQCNRQHSDGREAWGLAQHAQTVAKVLPEMVPPEPASGFVEMFFGMHDVAERASRGSPRLFLSQPLLPQEFALELQMCFDFRAEIARFSLASKHRASPPLQGQGSGR